MATHNFTASDLAGIFAGFCLFAFVTVIPGYALGWLTGVMRFRTRSPWFQLAMSVPLSIAIGPVMCFLTGSLSVALVLYGGLSLCTLFLLVKARPRFVFSKAHLQIVALVFVWIVVAVLSLVDLQINGRLYFSIVDFDYAVRTAFTSIIQTSGIPAQNPFFFPGHSVTLHYHYYWLILCALVSRAGGSVVDPRQALDAGTIWCGIGIICLVPLYLRMFSPRAATDLSRRSLIGISLLAVTGLDILPTLFMLWLYSQGHFALVFPSVELWNEQIDSWICTMLWEPHYLASVIACFTGFLVLWEAPEESGKRRIVSGIVAGIAFASAVGSGIYVAFVFAVFLTVWTLVAIVKKWHAEAAILVLAGSVAITASLPFLHSLRGPASGGGFLHLTVRSFRIGEILMASLRLDRPWQTALANLVFLPLNYSLELGFFLAAGLLAWKEFRNRKRSVTRQELAAFTIAGTSVVICTFMRSGVITSNDLGWRGFLIAQFMLLIWAADLLSTRSTLSLSGGEKALLTIMLILGAAGVAYDVGILRLFPLLSDAGKVPKIPWLGRDERLGERAFASREAYEWLRSRTPARAIIQQNPNPVYQDTFYGLYANRRTVAADSGCDAVFGGDPRECAPLVQTLTALFSGENSFETACASLPIDVFVAKDTDGAWKNRSSWVWTRTPVFANGFVRLFTCPSR